MGNPITISQDRHLDPIGLVINELAVALSVPVRFVMNDLRSGRWSNSGAAMSEPKGVLLQETWLLTEHWHQTSPNHPPKVTADWQSLIQCRANFAL